MREELLQFLRCPKDLGELNLDSPSWDIQNEHVLTGTLICNTCNSTYQIKEGVPCILFDRHEKNDHDIKELQNETMKKFGFEWTYFKDWGWLEQVPNVPEADEKYFGALLENSASAFWSKSLFQKDDLSPSHWVLDAGCGNGRFTYQAALTGANIIGIDLGSGVFSAFEHLKNMPNVHIVQGDLFYLPFVQHVFDRVFSIGVLMHTGNAAKAFDSLCKVLKPNGIIVAHVYGKGRRSYEILDTGIRSLTTRMPLSMQIRFARMTAAFARWLRKEPRKKLYNKIFSHINLLPTEIHMFDWWSAPIATHHTEEEVSSWFEKNKLKILRTNIPFDKAHKAGRRYWHGPITVLGISTKEG